MQKSKVRGKIRWQSQTIKNSVGIASSLILHSHTHMADQAADNYMIKLFYSQNPSSFLGQDVILGVSQGCVLKEAVCCCRSWRVCSKRTCRKSKSVASCLRGLTAAVLASQIPLNSGAGFWWWTASGFHLNSHRWLHQAFHTSWVLNTWYLTLATLCLHRHDWSQ